MKNLVFVFLLSSILILKADDVFWPKPGSTFPKQKPQEKIVRTGAEYWVTPPSVISPYDKNWFEFQTIIWGTDKRIENNLYIKSLKDLYVKAGLVYSDDDPKNMNDCKMPFYNTNVSNILYISNKGGDEIAKKFRTSRDKKLLLRSTNRGNASLENANIDSESISIAKTIASKLNSSKPLAYDLRDEGTYVISSCSPIDFDFSPESLKYFRIWLKQKYTSLEKLNAEWGCNFTDWEAVMPFTTDEIQSREFKRSQYIEKGTKFSDLNIAPWADHREYNDDTFHAAISRYTEAINQFDAGAPIGYSGTQMPSAYGGFDYWKMSKNISFIEYYDICGSRELLRGFMPSNAPQMGAIALKSFDKSQVSNRVWKQILHGDSGLLVWPFGKSMSETLIFDVNGTEVKSSKIGKEMSNLFHEFRNGISTLIRHSELECKEIAFYYSQSSLRLDWMLEVKRDGKSWCNRSSSWETTHNYAANGREGYYKLIEDIGFQYSHIAYAQAENDFIKNSGVKVLFMPRVYSLSDTEIESIVRFVESGGTLVCDIHFGTFNEHGVFRKENKRINEFLGVHRSEFIYQEDKKEEDSIGYKGGYGNVFDITLKSDFVGLKGGTKIKVKGFQELGIKANKSIAFGDTQSGEVLFANTVGKGRVITLNFDLANYLQERNSIETDVYNNCELQRNLFSGILRDAGVVPKLKVTNDAGNYPAGIETFVFKMNTVTLIALHLNHQQLIDWQSLADIAKKQESKDEIKLKIHLPLNIYVTNLFSSNEANKLNTIDVILQKDKPVIFSLMPYKVISVNANIGKNIEKNLLSLKVNLVTDSDKCGDHVLNAELFNQNDEKLPVYLVNIPLIKGKYEGNLDCSYLNAGKYKLVLKDVLSNVVTIKEFEIK